MLIYLAILLGTYCQNEPYQFNLLEGSFQDVLVFQGKWVGLLYSGDKQYILSGSSPDHIEHKSYIQANLSSLAHNDSTILAAGRNKIFQSHDGVHWSLLKQFEQGVSILDITWFDDHWELIGNRFGTSHDGITWQLTDHIGFGRLLHMTSLQRIDHQVYATGFQGVFRRDLDGEQWTQLCSRLNEVAGLIGNSTFIIKHKSVTSYIISSSNQVTWNYLHISYDMGNTWREVFNDNGAYRLNEYKGEFIFSSNNADFYYTSADGENWIAHAGPTAINTILDFNDQALSFGSHTSISKSSDIENWETQIFGKPGGVDHLEFDGETYVSAGGDSIAISDDLHHWHQRDINDHSLLKIVDLALAGDKWIILSNRSSYYSSKILWSTNTYDWYQGVINDNENGPSTFILNSIAQTPFGIFAGGYQLLHSENGSDWNRIELEINSPIRKLYWTGTELLAATHLGLFKTSDGQNWSDHAAHMAPTLFANNNTRLLLGTTSRVSAENESGEWVSYLKTQSSLQAMAYSNNAFYVLTKSGRLFWSEGGLSWNELMMSYENFPLKFKSASLLKDFNGYLYINSDKNLISVESLSPEYNLLNTPSVIPHIPNNEDWETHISIRANNQEKGIVHFDLFDSSGNQNAVGLDIYPHDEFSGIISTGSSQRGSCLITQGIESLDSLTYRHRVTGASVSIPLPILENSNLLINNLTLNENEIAGLAFMQTAETEQRVTITLSTLTDELISQKEVSLKPFQQWLGLINDLFPEIGSGPYKVSLSSDGKLSAICLTFSSGLYQIRDNPVALLN